MPIVPIQRHVSQHPALTMRRSLLTARQPHRQYFDFIGILAYEPLQLRRLNPSFCDACSHGSRGGCLLARG